MEKIEEERKKTEVEVPFWSNIFNKKKDDKSDIIRILRNIPIFSDLSNSQLKKVSLIVYERKFNIDETLFKEGNPGSGMFIIKDGTINIERLNEEGQAIILAKLKAGDFVGELSLLNDAARSATAICTSKTTILVFFREDLFDLIDREPQLGSKILKRLAIMIGNRLRETNETLLYYKMLAEKKNESEQS